MTTYGKELIIDLHDCDPAQFNRQSIARFFETLCRELDMEACELHFWDDVDVPEEEKQTEPHLKGTSAVQFIMTSSVTIHTLDLLGKVFLNIFSCKDFDSDKVAILSAHWFRGRVVNRVEVPRI